jgi:hypothetical protein
MNGTCQVIVGTKMCGRSAVGILTGKAHGSAGQPSKTRPTMVCEVCMRRKWRERRGIIRWNDSRVRPKCRARRQALRLGRPGERSDNYPR